MRNISIIILLLLVMATVIFIVDIITKQSTFVEDVPPQPILTPMVKPKIEPVELPKKPLGAKEKFIAVMKPAVVKVKNELDREYNRALKLIELEEQSAWLDEKMRLYSATDRSDLLVRMKTHPVSLVLAQAALESGWGSSRFYKEANNAFGIWSYDSTEPRIRASQTRGSKEIYVRKYSEVNGSIKDYFHMISSGYAYRDFRAHRAKIDNASELLKYLRHYSELRDEYVYRLYSVLKANRFYELDNNSTLMDIEQILPGFLAQREAQRELDAKSVDEIHQDYPSNTNITTTTIKPVTLIEAP